MSPHSPVGVRGGEGEPSLTCGDDGGGGPHSPVGVKVNPHSPVGMRGGGVKVDPHSPVGV